MISYKQLGFVNTREMFQKAFKGGYAVPAYNFNNMEQIQAIVVACVETQSPVILQVSSGARKYANQILLQYMGQGAVEMMKAYAKEKGLKPVPMALHLDHGDTFELAKSCVETGFSSVMIDGSHHAFEKNMELTRQVVEFAHKNDVTVEGELGVLAGIEDEVSAEHSTYTDPKDQRGFACDLDRDFARREQIQAGAVYAECRRDFDPAAASFRYSGGDRAEDPGFSDRTSRRVVCSRGSGQDHQ